MLMNDTTARLGTILREILAGNAELLPGTPATVKLARLECRQNQIDLHLWPADTLDQARHFYRRAAAAAGIQRLPAHGWLVRPNFHFGFAASGCCWTTTTISLSEYILYWRDKIDATIQIPRRSWNEYWDRLIRDGIAEPADRPEFDTQFVRTKKTTATPRPGLAAVFTWTLEEAESLDAARQFTAAVKGRIDEVLAALGERLLP